MYIERRSEDSPEYKFAFGRSDLYRVYKGIAAVTRYSAFRHPVAGFAAEDKVWVRPLEDYEVDFDSAKRLLTVDIDDGGDIYINLNTKAGQDEQKLQFNYYDVEELCDRPTQFLDRGIRQIRIDSLYSVAGCMRDFNLLDRTDVNQDYLLDC